MNDPNTTAGGDPANPPANPGGETAASVAPAKRPRKKPASKTKKSDSAKLFGIFSKEPAYTFTTHQLTTAMLVILVAIAGYLLHMGVSAYNRQFENKAVIAVIAKNVATMTTPVTASTSVTALTAVTTASTYQGPLLTTAKLQELLPGLFKTALDDFAKTYRPTFTATVDLSGVENRLSAVEAGLAGLQQNGVKKAVASPPPPPARKVPPSPPPPSKPDPEPDPPSGDEDEDAGSTSSAPANDSYAQEEAEELLRALGFKPRDLFQDGTTLDLAETCGEGEDALRLLSQDPYVKVEWKSADGKIKGFLNLIPMYMSSIPVCLPFDSSISVQNAKGKNLIQGVYYYFYKSKATVTSG